MGFLIGVCLWTLFGYLVLSFIEWIEDDSVEASVTQLLVFTVGWPITLLVWLYGRVSKVKVTPLHIWLKKKFK